MLQESKKGQLSKTGIVFALSIFYAVIFVFLGVVDVGDINAGDLSANESNFGTVVGDNNVTTDQGFFSVLSNIGIFNFFGNIITGIEVFPWWLNAIIFSPLIIMLIWIIVTSLPTFNGGG